MQTGDIFIIDRNVFMITGIFIGDGNTQNIVSIQSLTKKPGSAHGRTLDELFVPEVLVLAYPRFRQVLSV